MSSAENFIVELGTEELPPKSLETLISAFHEELLKLVDDAKLEHQQCCVFATPRRLCIIINQLASAQADKTIERQGPAVSAAYDDDGNPTPAALGFARSCGVEFSQLSKTETAKGERLSFQINETGKATKELMPELVKAALSKLPIAKSMRWGDHPDSFIRPVKWLLMMHGELIIPATLFRCESSNITYGHRFLSSGKLTLKSADDYEDLLQSNFVIADLEKRKSTINAQVERLANDLNATAVIEPSLLSEVNALVEWPVALAGNFDPSFLTVPPEALISTMSANQKYFHLKDAQQNLISKFITISNIESTHPNSIITGNERVIRPRFADAMFFFEQDCKHSLTNQANKLKKITFQKELGTIFDKTTRISSIGSEIAQLLNVDQQNIIRAALICKSDLVSQMVIEFPNLQGIMGQYYAANDGENAEVSTAMDEIYKPRFAGDHLPSTPTGIILALADRLDSLVGIFAAGQIPSGTKDPFALRRAALGIIRIIIEKKLPLSLDSLIDLASKNFTSVYNSPDEIIKNTQQLFEFFVGRIKALYLDKGFTNPIIQSVLSLGLTNPLDIDARINAVKTFSELKEANSLSESNKRVANILTKNASNTAELAVDKNRLEENAEIILYQAMLKITPEVNSLCDKLDYTNALTLLTELKNPIDAFFDSVMVMDEDLKLRSNRLAILQHLRNLFIGIADIAYLQK